MPLPPDLHPGAEPVLSTRVPAPPHPGFDSLSEWFQSPPAVRPAGLTEAEVTQMWRQADLDNATAIARLERVDDLQACLVTALARFGDLADRLRTESRRFTQVTSLQFVEAEDEK